MLIIMKQNNRIKRINDKYNQRPKNFFPTTHMTKHSITNIKFEISFNIISTLTLSFLSEQKYNDFAKSGISLFFQDRHDTFKKQ